MGFLVGPLIVVVSPGTGGLDKHSASSSGGYRALDRQLPNRVRDRIERPLKHLTLT